MYAVIASGGKQYKVEAGQVLRLEKLAGEVGETVELTPVLMLGGEGEPQIGQPSLEGMSIKATIVEQGKAKKVMVFKKKRRKGYQVKRGHRQPFTAVRISEIPA